MATLQLTNRQSQVLAESIERHEPNVLHLQQERPYGNLSIEIHSPRGHESIRVPEGLAPPVERSWVRKNNEAVTSRGH